MKTSGSIEIDRSIGEVFRFTTDHVSEWSDIVLEDEILEETPEGVGTTFRMVTSDRGVRMEFVGVVTSHDPPAAQSVSMKGRQFDLEVDYLFEDLGGRTRVTQHSKVAAHGLLKVVFLLAGWAMKRSSCQALERELASLKHILESSPPAPAA